MPLPALAAITVHSATGVARLGVRPAGDFMLIDSVTESATRSQSRIMSARGVTAQITEADFRFSMEVRGKARQRRGLANRHPGEVIPLEMLDWFFDGPGDLHFGYNPSLHTEGYERNAAGRALYHSPVWEHGPGRLPRVSFVIDVEFSPGAWSATGGDYYPDIDAPGAGTPGTGADGGGGGLIGWAGGATSGTEPGGESPGDWEPADGGGGEEEEEGGP